MNNTETHAQATSDPLQDIAKRCIAAGVPFALAYEIGDVRVHTLPEAFEVLEAYEEETIPGGFNLFPTIKKPEGVRALKMANTGLCYGYGKNGYCLVECVDSTNPKNMEIISWHSDFEDARNAFYETQSEKRCNQGY